MKWVVVLATALAFASCGREGKRTTVLAQNTLTARLVFRDSAGRELTTKDLEGISGAVRWELVGASAVPSEASRLHAEGRAAGSGGDYARAQDLFVRAHRLAPDWPYPVYDMAFTYLLQGDSVKAEEHYAEVDRMAPRGFFTAKTSLDCLRRERAGIVPAGFCSAFATLEWENDKTKKRALLEGIVEQFPAFPAAWKELSFLLDDKDARLRAITQGLEHDPDPETRGTLLINRAGVLLGRGDRQGAVDILGELALDPQSTLATEVLAKATLATFVR